MITEKEFEIVFSTEDTILHFSTQIFENAARLLNDHGMGGYKEKWIEPDFPIDKYNRLKALLKKNSNGILGEWSTKNTRRASKLSDKAACFTLKSISKKMALRPAH